LPCEALRDHGDANYHAMLWEKRGAKICEDGMYRRNVKRIKEEICFE
jgi:hypothetical protein